MLNNDILKQFVNQLVTEVGVDNVETSNDDSAKHFVDRLVAQVGVDSANKLIKAILERYYVELKLAGLIAEEAEAYIGQPGFFRKNQKYMDLRSVKCLGKAMRKIADDDDLLLDLL